VEHGGEGGRCRRSCHSRGADVGAAVIVVAARQWSVGWKAAVVVVRVIRVVLTWGQPSSSFVSFAWC
jgi:hypothetical protein